jgi:hypothetical protein
MKILVLEDDAERIAWFVKSYGNEHDLTVCTTVEAFKASYMASDIDFVFLDHDLGGRVYVDSDDPNTGYQAAMFMNASMSGKDGKRPKQVVIHSWNNVAVPRMARALADMEAAGTDVLPLQFGTFTPGMGEAY